MTFSITNNKSHALHYAILALELLAGLLLLFIYRSQPNIQFYIGIGIATSYFLWGIAHHYLHEDLHRKHVIEYGLIAILGVILLKIILL
jgi:hypothetical protein